MSGREPRLVPRALRAAAIGGAAVVGDGAVARGHAMRMEGAVVLSYAVAPELEPGLARLTASEREVVTLALDGLDHLEIARATGRSRHTVANLLRRAYRRFGIGSKAEIAAAVVDR